MKLDINKKIIRYVLEGIVLIAILIFFFIVNKNIDEENAKLDTEGYKYYIERLKYNDESGEIVILGWCIKEGIACPDASSRPVFKVWLAKDGNRDEMIEIPVVLYKRTDVTRGYGKESINYDYSGFMGSVKVDASIKESTYRVLFQYDASQEKYFYTTRCLENGEMIIERNQWD